MIEPRRYSECGSVYAPYHGEWGGETYRFDGLQEAIDEAYQAHMEDAFPNVRVWWTDDDTRQAQAYAPTVPGTDEPDWDADADLLDAWTRESDRWANEGGLASAIEDWAIQHPEDEGDA